MDPLSLIGKTLAGHFLVESLAGEGRFSLVYKGQHVGPQEPVALKCLKLGLELDPTSAENFLRRFREENRTHSRVSRGDPHFARTIGSGMTTSASGAHVPYTVLEWLVGHSLADDFRRRREGGSVGRPLIEVIEMLDGPVSAIAFAHDSGVPHGDLNAGNFFLATGEGAPATLKVLDFGMAKVLADVTREIVPNAMKPRMFNPAYGAPEHFDSSLGELGPWTDVYSLALIVLEALRDKAPIEGDFKAAALNRKTRPSPQALGIRTGDTVEAAIGKALAVAPADRFQHAEAFWSALKEAAKNDSVARAPGADDEEGDTLLKKPVKPPAPAAAPVAAPPPPVVAPHAAPLAAAKPASAPHPVAAPAAPAPSPLAHAAPPKAAPLPASAFSAHGMSPGAPNVTPGPAITPPMLQTGKPAHLGTPAGLGVQVAPAGAPPAKFQAKRTFVGVAPPAPGARVNNPGAGVLPGLIPDEVKKTSPHSPENFLAAPITAPLPVPAPFPPNLPPASPAQAVPNAPAPLPAPPPPPPPSGAAALTLLGAPGEVPAPITPKSSPRTNARAKVAPVSENKVTIEPLLPPKATHTTEDLPSVIVDEPPEQHQERMARNKQTLIIRSSSAPITPMANWVPEPPPPSFVGPVVPSTAMPIAESAYERRPSRARRRLTMVAVITFIFVSVAVGGILGMKWYLARSNRSLPPIPFLNP